MRAYKCVLMLEVGCLFCVYSFLTLYLPSFHYLQFIGQLTASITPIDTQSIASCRFGSTQAKHNLYVGSLVFHSCLPLLGPDSWYNRSDFLEGVGLTAQSSVPVLDRKKPEPQDP